MSPTVPPSCERSAPLIRTGIPVTHLYDTNIWLFARIVYGDLGDSFNPVLDAVGYVGYNLQRANQDPPDMAG